MVELIQKLSDMRGISGFEYRITEKIAELFKPYCDEVRIDAMGSVIAVRRCGIADAPKIMIEAHCDEIGLMVTSVTDEGFLTIANVGGVDQRILPSQEVTVHAMEDIWGVIGIKPVHMLEDGKTVKTSNLAIDTGLDREEVKRLVSVGDSVTISQSVGRIGGGQLSGKSLDDRAGVAAIINVMKGLDGAGLKADVYAVAAVQEEVGCRGGKTTAYGIDPDVAIAIDVTHAETPDNTDCDFETGSGAAVAVGPNLHPRLTEKLFETAKKHSIKAACEVEGGDTGTDAWEIQTARNGVPTALLSIPLKYMHTSVETIALSDAEAVAALITEFIKESGGDLSWLTL